MAALALLPDKLAGIMREVVYPLGCIIRLNVSPFALST